MDKTVYKQVLAVETISVLPRTLDIRVDKITVGKNADGDPVNADMHVVFGLDPADRKVWVATFVDVDEASSFIHASKTFGRPVLGAVLGGQEVKSEKGAEMSDAAVEAPGSDSGKAN